MINNHWISLWFFLHLVFLIIHGFRFYSIYRLLNPKIIRACVVVLSDWEQIPTKSLKAAVTILHRIAYGCSCPAMLYQVSLRVIQFTCDSVYGKNIVNKNECKYENSQPLILWLNNRGGCIGLWIQAKKKLQKLKERTQKRKKESAPLFLWLSFSVW